MLSALRCVEAVDGGVLLLGWIVGWVVREGKRRKTEKRSLSEQRWLPELSGLPPSARA